MRPKEATRPGQTHAPRRASRVRVRTAPRKRRDSARPTMVGPRRGDFAFLRPHTGSTRAHK
eukprot:3306230-Prymnesium_polylepis.1